MSLKKFEQAIEKCEALTNYHKLKKKYEKLREENTELKKIKLSFQGKPRVLDNVYKKLKKDKREIKEFKMQILYWNTIIGVEGSLDNIPIEKIIKILKNVEGWLMKKDWTLDTSLFLANPHLSSLLYKITTSLEKKFTNRYNWDLS